MKKQKKPIDLRGLSHSNVKNLYLKFQENKCAICGEPIYKETAKLDHCHRTGKARGALCSGCNMGLGFFKDSTRIMERAIKYVEGRLDGHPQFNYIRGDKLNPRTRGPQ